MANAEMNRRLRTMTAQKIDHIMRLIRGGYEPRDIYNFHIGAKLSQINAVWKMMGMV